jgi:hypothetical protein
MICRAGVVVALAVVTSFAGAGPAVADPAPSVSSYYLARADPRLCPSPMCGGIWVHLVNASATTCGNGAREEECYAASTDLTRLPLDEKRRAQLQALIGEGRAVARGRLVRGRVDGFPDLDTFVVSEVWTASSSPGRPRGVVHRLRDRGIRCVTTPCFSIHAAVLNSGRHIDVSGVDLAPTGAPRRERARALQKLHRSGLIASGRVVRKPNAGPAGIGRVFVASQFYVRAAAASRRSTSHAKRTSSSVVRKLPIASRRT